MCAHGELGGPVVTCDISGCVCSGGRMCHCLGLSLMWSVGALAVVCVETVCARSELSGPVCGVWWTCLQWCICRGLWLSLMWSVGALAVVCVCLGDYSGPVCGVW